MWIHHWAIIIIIGNLHVEWLKTSYLFFGRMCWIRQEKKHEMRLIHTIVNRNYMCVWCTCNFNMHLSVCHYKKEFGVWAAAMAVIILAWCLQSFILRLVNQRVCTHYDIESECIMVDHRRYFFISCADCRSICSTLQIVILFQLPHTIASYNTQKWAHFNVSDTPVLGVLHFANISTTSCS